MFEQVAFFTKDLRDSVERFTEAGFGTWTHDIAAGRSSLEDVDGDVPFRAKLAFNYDVIPGVEFELIEPLTVPNYIEVLEIGHGCLAHVGVHVEGEGMRVAWKGRLGLYGPVQRTLTTHHMNPNVGDRRYSYEIWLSRFLPFPVKLIERLER